jgi:hypothetical protein
LVDLYVKVSKFKGFRSSKTNSDGILNIATLKHCNVETLETLKLAVLSVFAHQFGLD